MLVLSEDRKMLMDSARGAVATKAPIAAFRKLRADVSGEGFSRAFWRECAELGWTGVLIPEEFGGIDFGIVGAGLIARELARTLAPSPFLSTAVIAASALRNCRAASLKTEWLPRIARGEAIVALAIDGKALSNKSADGRTIAGVKHMVLDGHVADAFLISARDANGESGLYFVEADAPGLSRDTRTLVDGHRVASLALDGVKVKADDRLGGSELIDETLDVARAVTSASLCGVAEEAFTRTMAYLKDRRQFDHKIGSFQALQHRAAKLHIEIENAWSATLKAMESLDGRANGAALDVAIAKAKASDVACLATAESLQMHGGIGMTDEFDIGLFLKRARVESVLFGDAAFHADRVATMLGY